MRRTLLTIAASVAVLAGTASAAHADDDVTIYRCTDADDRLTIGNSPCPEGQRQQTQTMLRPKDAPARPAPVPATAPEPAPPPRVIVINAPRPLYECVRPDGTTYDSDSSDGEARWVPLWTLGYPVGVGSQSYASRDGLSAPPSSGLSASPSSGLSAPPSSSISIPPARDRPRPPTISPRPPRPPRPGYGYGYDPGTWIRDACNPLPQGEVCARLSDRRDELRRRFFNAQQRERDTLRVEERGLSARLSNDCGVN